MIPERSHQLFRKLRPSIESRELSPPEVYKLLAFEPEDVVRGFDALQEMSAARDEEQAEALTERATNKRKLAAWAKSNGIRPDEPLGEFCRRIGVDFKEVARRFGLR